jgi:hypothetical protein
MLVLALAWFAAGAGASRRLTSYAMAIALAMSGLVAYLATHGFVGFQAWTY